MVASRLLPLLVVALLAAACSSSGDPAAPEGGATTIATVPPPTSRPAATSTSTTTTAPAPTTTAPASDVATFEVDTSGVRPDRIVVKEGATAVEFANVSERDFEVTFQGGEPAGFQLAAGGSVTVDFAGLPGAVYSFRALLGNGSFPGTVDTRLLEGPVSLGSVTSWDGTLTAGHPKGISGWAFGGLADGVLGGAEDLGADFPARLHVTGFLQSLGGGREMDTPGVLAVFSPVDGDLDGAGQAAIVSALPPGCEAPAVEPATRSGLEGAETLAACGDASFRHGYLAAPDAGGIVEYWAFYLDDDDARAGDTMLDNLSLRDPAAEPSTRAVHVRPAEQGRDEAGGAAVVGLAAGVPEPPSAWLGPWNSGTVEFANRADRAYRVVWADPALAPLDVPAGGSARADLPPDGEARAYTVVSATGRGVGEVTTYEPSEPRVIADERFGDVPPLVSVTMPLVEPSTWRITPRWPWLVEHGVSAAGGAPGIEDFFAVSGPMFAAGLEGLPEPASEDQLRISAEIVAGRVEVDGADCEQGEPVDGTLAGWTAVTYTFACTGALAEVTATTAWPGDPAEGMLIVVTAVADDEDRWHVREALETLAIADNAIGDLRSAVDS